MSRNPHLHAISQRFKLAKAWSANAPVVLTRQGKLPQRPMVVLVVLSPHQGSPFQFSYELIDPRAGGRVDELIPRWNHGPASRLIPRWKRLVRDPAAAVKRGAEERIVPILMTALAAGLALVSLALAAVQPGSEIQAPMAIVILFGLATSTLLNMIVVPALYLRFGAIREEIASGRTLRRRASDVVADG